MLYTSPQPFTPRKGLIQGRWSTREVWYDGRVLFPGPSQKVRNHSPDGFAWSYNGSGPAQLALAICLRLTDTNTAEWLYQQFKRDKIATLPAADFSLSLKECHEWIAAHLPCDLEEEMSFLPGNPADYGDTT